MTELLTAAQMRAIEQGAIERGRVSGLKLMERAGAGVVEAVLGEWPELGKGAHRAVVLCGPGNNGGDGFVVARLLGERGWQVEVCLFGDPDRLPPDAKANCARWRQMGDVLPLKTGGEAQDLDLFDDAACGADCDFCVVFDALFGTGLTRPLGDLALLMRQTAILDDRDRGGRFLRVAVDLPSGLCSDSGRVLIDDPSLSRFSAFRADLTVTFHAMKLGHVLADGPGRCGKVAIADIGLPFHMSTETVKMPAIRARDLDKAGRGHKYGHGHALILTGGPGQTGAARLAARGALRIGAGLVTLGVPGAAQHEVACQITALMLIRVEDGPGLAARLADPRINALCLGPGLGVARAHELVPVACGGVNPRPLVLDADALTAFEADPDALFKMLHEGCVLTPHAGEFSRLFPDLAEGLNAAPTSGPACSKVDATRAAAARAGCVVLFKGADTVIAAPDGRCVVNPAHYERAAPWLATAGAGDVLAGFITGLLARGFSPMSAAETAAWLHVECACRFGPGLIAEDLPGQLPAVLREIGVRAGAGQAASSMAASSMVAPASSMPPA